MLLLGRRGIVIEDAERRLNLPDVRLIGGTGLQDVRDALARCPVNHVIMGAGIDLETRLAIVREVFEHSDQTTVHLKDRASGPASFLPFAQAVLRGLEEYQEDTF